MKKYFDKCKERGLLPTLFRETIATPGGLHLQLPLFWYYDSEAQFANSLFSIFEGTKDSGRSEFWRDIPLADRKALVRKARSLGLRDTKSFVVPAKEIVVESILLSNVKNPESPTTMWRLFSAVLEDGNKVPLYRVTTRLGHFRSTLYRVARWPFGPMASNIINLSNQLHHEGPSTHCHQEIFYPSSCGLQEEIEWLYDSASRGQARQFCAASDFDLAKVLERFIDPHISVCKMGRVYAKHGAPRGDEVNWVMNNPVILSTSPRRAAYLTNQLVRVLEDRQHAQCSWALDFHKKLYDCAFVNGARCCGLQNNSRVCLETENEQLGDRETNVDGNQ